MKKMLQELLKAASNSTSVTYSTVHCMQKSPQELCKFTSSSQDLSIIYLRVVNSHRFNQSDLDTRSWYHGTAASKECLQALLSTPSSPDRSRLVPLPLGYLALNPALNPACSQAKTHVQCKLPVPSTCSLVASCFRCLIFEPLIPFQTHLKSTYNVTVAAAASTFHKPVKRHFPPSSHQSVAHRKNSQQPPRHKNSQVETQWTDQNHQM